MYQRIMHLLLFIFLILTNLSYANDYLRVRNPQNWYSSQGTIEEAVISIRPHGLYMEVGLYLTFSARGWYYSSTDSLEVEFYFDLPEDAIVHDSWLWIGNEIIRGEILDKWTASEIYEEIVNRRRDPSILFKRTKTNYELRIYPMAANETRKVKLTYLVPTQWSSDKVLAALPTNLLRTSRYAVSTFYLLTWFSEQWVNPQILEFPSIAFAPKSDAIFGDYVRADIPSDAIQSSIHFALSSPLKNGIYLSNYNTGDEGIYQLVFLPSHALNLSAKSKVAVLFDYDASNCNISTTELLNSTKAALKSSFTAQDSFNLIFSQLNINRTSETWLSADPQIIDQTFAGLGDNPVSTYSNLPSLLANGIEFVKDNGNDGSIVLISSTDQVGDYRVANQLISDLLALMPAAIPIHVADYQDRDYSYYYIAGRSYYGNEYFYTNIARLTSANYFNVRSGYTFPEFLTTTLNAISGFLSSFDLHTRLLDGYCFARYNLHDERQSVYLDKPIMQIGKYMGGFPFVIEASGMYESEVFSQQFELDPQGVTVSDSLARTAWTGNLIEHLESQEQNNDVINEIVYYSLSERVLSIYSAFLCLEPSRGGQVCYDCMDETNLVGIEDQLTKSDRDTLLAAYPNPFNNQVTISVRLPELKFSDDVTVKIYNVLGQEVKNFEITDKISGNSLQIDWNGTNDSGVSVSSGTYFLIVKTAAKVYSLKLLYMK